MKSNSQFNAEVFKKYNNMIEEKNDKFFFRHVYKKNYSDISKIAIFFVVFLMIFIGTIYATIYVYNRKQTKLTPTYTETIGDTNMNNIWVGTFQLVWNEFMEQRVKGNVEFENENNIKDYLHSVFDSIILRDVVERLGLKDVTLFNLLLQYIIDTTYIVNYIPSKGVVYEKK